MQNITQGIAVDVTMFKDDYYDEVKNVISEATLVVPEMNYFQSGGKYGRHTEHMGYLLADLQYMQRTFPNMTW